MQISVEGYHDLSKHDRDNNDYDDVMAIIDLPKSGAPVSLEKKMLIDLTKRITKKPIHSTSDSHNFILRMDAIIDEMDMVTSIPVELPGIRSYPLRHNVPKSKSTNLSLVVNVKARRNIQVSFETSAILANN